MNDLVEKIKIELDIITALQRYTNADITRLRGRRKGNIICPFHSEKTPSFLVDTVNNTWHCFGACATGGDVINLYAIANNIKDNREATKLLASELGLITHKLRLNTQARKEFIRKKKENEIIRAVEKDIKKTYTDLCYIYNTMQDIIREAKSAEELNTISIILDKEPYVNYLLDCLLSSNGEDAYLKAYVEAKEVIEEWNLIWKK